MNLDRSRTTDKLQSYERHVACMIISVLLALGIVGIDCTGRQQHDKAPLIRLKVVGAVESIEIDVPIGVTIEEVLRRVHLSDEADLAELDGMKKIKSEGILVIPYKNKNTFFVCGAIEEPKLVVLDGEISASKILENVIPNEKADVKSFMRRRVFQNGTIIFVKEKRAVREKK